MPNLLTNPGFETGDFTGWSSAAGTSVTSSEAHSGTYSCQCTTQFAKVSQTPAGSAGKTYSTTVWVKVTGSGRIRFRLIFMNSGGGTISFEGDESTSTSWVQLTLTAVAPVGTVEVRVQVDNINASGSGFADDFVLEEVLDFEDTMDGGVTLAGNFSESFEQLNAFWRLDETVGTTAQDEVGGNDGELVNNADWNSGGKINGCVEFDGAGDGIDVPSFNVGPAITICAWFKQNSSPAIADSRIFSKATAAAEADHTWMLSTVSETELRARLKIDGTTYTLVGTDSFSNNVWNFGALTYDGTTMKLYLNGSFDAATVSQSGSIDETSAKIGIGNLHSDYAVDRAFDGFIDHVKVFNYALTEAELDLLYSISHVDEAFGAVAIGGSFSEIYTPPSPAPAESNLGGGNRRRARIRNLFF